MREQLKQISMIINNLKTDTRELVENPSLHRTDLVDLIGSFVGSTNPNYLTSVRGILDIARKKDESYATMYFGKKEHELKNRLSRLVELCAEKEKELTHSSSLSWNGHLRKTHALPFIKRREKLLAKDLYKHNVNVFVIAVEGLVHGLKRAISEIDKANSARSTPEKRTSLATSSAHFKSVTPQEQKPRLDEVAGPGLGQ